VCCCVPAVLVVIALLRAFAGRLAYATDVEGMEGGSLLQAHRVLHGQPVYPEPGRGFMPYPYPPLHTLVLAALGKVFGLGFALGRSVSVAALVLAMALLAREVYLAHRRLSLPGVWTALAVGLIAAGFPFSWGAYDIIRVDTLAVALAIAGAVAVSDAEANPSRVRWLAATGLLVLAIFAKQTNVFFVGWLVAFVAIRNPKRGLAFGLAVGSCSAIVALALQGTTHGNYWVYTVTHLRRHSVYPAQLWGGLVLLSRFAPYLAAVPLVTMALSYRRALSRRTLLWAGMTMASLPVALLPYAKLGGWFNTFIAVVVLAGPAALCLAADALTLMVPKRTLARVARVGVAVVTAAYLVARAFDPALYTPAPENVAAVTRLNAYVRSLSGGVLFPMKPFTAVLGGELTEQVDGVGWLDYLLAGGSGSFRPFLQHAHPRWVILTGVEPANIVAAMDGEYFLRGLTPAGTREATLLPRPAGPPSPLFVFERDAADPARSRCLFDFESGTYRGFTVKGDSFQRGPLRFRPARDEGFILGIQGVVVGGEGSFLASTANSDAGERATGAALSEELDLDGAEMRLRVGGGAGNDVRVELLVDGEVRHSASGRGVGYMEEVVWEMGADRGKRARLAIIDGDTAQHILVDRVRLTDSDGAAGFCR